MHSSRPHFYLITVFATVILSLGWLVTPVQADTITVSGACTLSDAIVAANTDTAIGGCAAGNGADIISIPAGTLQFSAAYLTTNTALPAIASNINFVGASQTTTIIQRNASAPTNFRLFEVTSGIVNFSNMTIENGIADSGGAILINGGQTAFNNVRIRNNRATQTGGGISITAGTLAITNSLIRDNISQSAVAGGGGIYASSGATSINITNTTLSGNLSSGVGGAMYTVSNPLTVANITANGNISGNQGGAIYAQGDIFTVSSSVFSSNVASDGGAIFAISNSAVQITTTTIDSNSSTNGGGGIRIQDASSPTLSKSTVSNNVSTNGVGGVLVDNSSLGITNSTISGNQGQSGAIRVINGGNATMNFTTIYNNTRQGSVASNAGGVALNGSTASISYSLIGNNSGTDCLLTNGATATGTDNLIEGTCGSVSSLGVPSGVLALANNGGSTRTHALSPTSNALEVAPNSACTAAAAGQDQRNISRIEAAPSDPCDIGAFELQGTTVSITISPTTLNDAYVGLAYSATLTAIGGTAPYTWTSPDEPAGLTLNTNGTITGTPTSAGDNQTFTVTVTDNLSNVKTETLTISIKANPDLMLTPTLLPNARQGVAYSTTVVASGGSGNYSFALAGSSPTGLNISGTGQLTGTMNTPGTYAFQIAVTDTTLTYTQNIDVTLVVKPIPTFSVSTSDTISSTILPSTQVNQAYTAPVYIDGGTPPYSFNVIEKPQGLNLVPDGFDAKVTGTATEGGGTFQFNFDITDADGFQTSVPFSITIEIDDKPTIPTTTLPDGARGVFYDYQFVAEGGFPPYTYSLASGSTLPPNLVLAPSGRLSGTPDVAGVSGTINFSVIARDNTGVNSDPILMTLYISPIPVITIAPTTPVNSGTGDVILPQGALTVAYAQTFTASGGTTSGYTYSVSTGTLPPGLTFNPDGTLTGTPTTIGTYTFTVQGEDQATTPNVGTEDYELEILATPVITVTPTTLPEAYTNVPYTTSLTGSGGTAPYTFASSNLPAGLSISGSNIVGTPTGSGTFLIDITATDANSNSGVTQVQLTVGAVAPITISPDTLPVGTVNTPYSVTLTASNGNGTYTFLTVPVSPNPLPPGLILSSNGRISGTPTAEGTSSFSIIVTDGNGVSATKNYTITVNRQVNVVYVSQPETGNSIDIGVVAIGTSATRSLVISEGGIDTLEVSVSGDALIINDENGIFSVGGDVPPFSITDGGASRTLDITCTPQAVGIVEALLVMNTNDSTKPSVSYTLICSGARELAEGESQYVLPAIPATTARVFFVRGMAHRSGPYLGATMLGIIRPDNDYPVFGKSDDEGGEYTWYLIEANDELGWASGRYLEINGSDQIPVVQTIFEQIDSIPDSRVKGITYTNLHVRIRPSLRSAILATTEWGAEFVLLGRTRQAGLDQWYHVRYTNPDGRTITGWVDAAWIQVTSPIDVDSTPIR